MRRQYFWWTYLVGAIVCIAYGGYTLIYHFQNSNTLSVHSLILLILGSVALAFFLALYVVFLFQKKKNAKTSPTKSSIEEDGTEDASSSSEEKEEERESVFDSKEDEETAPEPAPRPERKRDYEYSRSPSRSYETDAYIRKVGYGPVLRVSGARILDMRNNTYYHLQGNTVNQDGYGPVYEISGNRIRSAFGGYLYEISGDNVNKIYGGFFASFSGNTIVKHDASERYEVSDSLSLAQRLAVVALLFGNY